MCSTRGMPPPSIDHDQDYCRCSCHDGRKRHFAPCCVVCSLCRARLVAPSGVISADVAARHAQRCHGMPPSTS